MKNLFIAKRFILNYLCVLTGAFFLLSYNNPGYAQKKENADAYKTFVKQADMAFDASDYKKALELYEKAAQAKPEYNYPADKINEIKTILDKGADPKVQTSTQPVSGNASYKLLLAKADYEYTNKDFAAALLFYDKAAKTRPEYSYAPGKSEEIYNLLKASPETRTRIFENTMLKAESFYEQENYKEAKSEYEKATLIDTSAQVPKDRLKQISSVFTDPDDISNFKLAVANGDKALASSDYDRAIVFYEAAHEMHPKAKFVDQKITEAKTGQTALKAKTQPPASITPPEITAQPKITAQPEITAPPITVAVADKPAQPDLPAKTTQPDEIAEAVKTAAAQKQLEQAKYDATLAAAENALKSGNYEAALAGFKSASASKPTEKYTQLKIAEVEKMQKEKIFLKESDEKYAAAIASGDRFLSASRYAEALVAYKEAISVKPNEAYPAEKTAEINALLAKQKSDSENYAQALRTGEKALAAGNYNLALTSFLNAEKIKPSESYPKQQLVEIKALMALQQEKDEKYTQAITTADQLFARKDYNGSLAAYTEAATLKKNEKYPQDQIFKINKIITDSRSVDDNYKLAITEGDKLAGMKDYSGAISAFSKASALKPAEAYPSERMAEINKMVAEIKLAHSSGYTKALEVADKLYNAKIFDQAIEAYETAAKINPADAYPELQINKIRKYMSDHAILDLNSQAFIISKGTEKKFTFSAINPSLRKNNYILIKARTTGNTIPKVYLSYGKDNSKNGGIVLRTIDKSTLSDLLISISIQDKWFREENNWLSISVETGEIEITSVQIAAGE